jgi:hypothetical protein
MAFEDTTNSAPAPASASVAPPSIPEQNPASAPDLSALTQPGPNAAQPNVQTAAMGSYQKAVSDEATANQKAADLANQAGTLNPGAGGHQRLLSMIQGIGAGLSAFGTAIATKGEKGGGEMAADILGKEQEQKIQAQQASQAQRNQAIQNQLTIGSTNRTLGQNMLLLATLPQELQMKDLQLSEAQQRVASGKAALADTQAEFMSKFGMNTDQFNSMIGGSTGAGGNAVPIDPKAVANMTAFAQQKIKAASQILHPDDPYLQKAQTVIADPKSSPQDIFGAVSSVNRQLGLQQQVTAASEKQEQVAAGARPKDLNDAVGRLTQAQQAYAVNPTPANKLAVDNAQAARSNFLSADAAVKRTAQLIQDGDPNLLAQGLVNGDIAWSQVVSSRKPEFATAAFKAADELSKAQTGKPFSATVNETNFKQATNPQVQSKLKMIEGMTEKGGSIDIAQQAASKLPGFNEKTANRVFNAVKGEFGNPAISNFQTAMVGLADEYSQVMGSGAGTDSSRQQALDILHDGYSKGQLAGAIAVMKADINARQKALIGDNPTLKQLFPAVGGTQQQAAPAGATGKARASDGNWYYHDAQGNNLGKAQ